MPTLAATNGSPEAGAGSSGRRKRPIGSRRSVASETDDQRKANWLSARLANAFQVAWRTAAHTTRARAGPLTVRSYRTPGDGMRENPSIDRGLALEIDSETHDYRPDAPCETVRRRVLPGRPFRQGYRSVSEIRGPGLFGRPRHRAPQEDADESLPRQLGQSREADRRERGRLPAAGHPPEDRRARGVLPGVQGRGDPARHSRRCHHHLREAVHIHPALRAARPG